MPLREVKPQGNIKHQAQTSVPTTSDSTIMDDTVVIMDSATALMGGKTVTMPIMKQSIETIKPQATIRIRR